MNFERTVSGRFVDRVYAALEAPQARAAEAQVPVERFAADLDALARRRYPGVATGEALRRVGRDVVAHARRDGPIDSTMRTMAAKFEAIGEFLEPRVHVQGDRVVAHFGDVASLHTFFLGLIEGVTSSTRENVRVEWRLEGLSGARYDVVPL